MSCSCGAQSKRARRLDAEALLEDVNAAADLVGKQEVVQKFWASEPQRVTHLLGLGLSIIKAQPEQTNPVWSLAEQSRDPREPRPSPCASVA